MPSHKPLAPIEVRSYLFKKILLLSGIASVLFLVGMFITLVMQSSLAIQHMGASFIFGSIWDPVKDIYGALPFFLGTLISATLALLISIPFAFSLSIFLGEYLKEGILKTVLNSTLDVLAGIPSVIYGFWGLFVMTPVIRNFETAIGVTPHGVGILSASLILALMIIPYSASISREVIALVPQDLKEATFSLGSTRFELISKVILPYAKSGMFAGFLMSFGRAISETMAVTMLIGNSNKIPSSIFSPANTLASVIANEFAEASEALYLSSLMQLALVLFIITTVFGFVGRWVIKRWVVPV